MNKCFVLIVSLIFILPYQTTSQSTEKVKLFLDCTQYCDGDFLRSELKMIDFVRDRFLCDIQIIQNSQYTNNGGESVELKFLGNNRFSGIEDTLKYFIDVTFTDKMKREKMLQFIKLGLIRYLSRTEYADKLQIAFTSTDSTVTEKQKDPWNYWQFSIGTSAFFDGNENNSSQLIQNSLSAFRETEQSKFSFQIYSSINRREFKYYNQDLDSTEVIQARTDAQEAFGRYIIKFDEHWGYGLNGSVNRSLFNNIDINSEIKPVLEYSVFPYKQFNTTRLVINYEIGPQYLNYRDTTIYLKTKEVLLRQGAGAIASFTKDWGNINIGAFWNNYLNDLSKNRFFLGGAVSWNVFKGFKFSVGGNYELVHDQISIPKLGASRDDLLTQRRLIASSYSYFMGLGFSYTFGSIYNSQVHPTFRGLNFNLSL